MTEGSVPAYFRPPPETFAMFDDLAADDDESSEEEIQRPQLTFPPRIISQRRLQPRVFARPPPRPIQPSGVLPTAQSYRQERPSRPAPPATPVADRPRSVLPAHNISAYRPPSQHLVGPPPLYTRTQEPVSILHANKEAKKRSEQEQRLDQAEEDLEQYLDEFPDDTKFKAKQLQLQAYRDKCKNGKLLSRAETEFVRGIARSIDGRRVTIEAKQFAEQLKPRASSARSHKKRRPLSPTPSPQPSSHPTTSGKTITKEVLDQYHPSKRAKLTEDPAALDFPEEFLEQKQADVAGDVNDSDTETEPDGRSHYGGKSIASTHDYSFTPPVRLKAQKEQRHNFEQFEEADDQTEISESDGSEDTEASDTPAATFIEPEQHTDTAMEERGLEVDDDIVSEASNDAAEVHEDDEREGHWQYTLVQYDHRNYTPASSVSQTLGTFTDRDEAVAAIDHRIQELAENSMWKDAEVRNVTNEADELWARDIHSDTVGSVEIRIQKTWIAMVTDDDDKDEDHEVCRRTWSGKGIRQPKQEPQHTYVIWMEQKDMTSGTIIKCDVDTKSFSNLRDANRHAAKLWQSESMSENEAPPGNLDEILESPSSLGPGFLGEVEIGDDFFHKHFLIYKGDDLVQITISVRMLEVDH